MFQTRGELALAACKLITLSLALVAGGILLLRAFGCVD